MCEATDGAAQRTCGRSLAGIAENRAAGAIKLRVETIDYFLRRHRDDSVSTWKTLREMEAYLADARANAGAVLAW